LQRLCGVVTVTVIMGHRQGALAGRRADPIVAHERRERLVESLGAVAVAALDTAVPLSGTIVKHLVAVFSTHPEPGLRELDRAVVGAIEAWALRDDVEGVEVGLALATDTIAQHGLTLEELAELDYDGKKAASAVLGAAHRADRRWRRRGFFKVQESYHDVAERAIRGTYAAMAERLAHSQRAILPSIVAARRDLAHIEVQVAGVAEQLDQLADVLVGAATVGDVMAYLGTRIGDWDDSEWGGHIPSVLARRLTVRAEQLSRGGAPFLTEDEALAGQQMLVVLGGPGSGKTWLAYRYAREAAQTALSALEDGADLDKVEIPVFTTWHQWSTAEGSARSSVVDASFESRLGHRDVENEAVNRRVRHTLKSTARLLIVIDSLDEAAQVPAEKGNLLRAVAPTTGQQHRVVITSRPSAWNAIKERLPRDAETVRVVELQDLDEKDVTGFVETWFENDRARAAELNLQMRRRPDLARAVVIPLFLTFYCRIVESGNGVESLPTRRDRLYSLVVRNTFHRIASTKPTVESGQSTAHREQVLAEWAWKIGGLTTSTGMGGWGETFTLDEDSHDPALDAVAPRLQISETGSVTRRFQHRTFLEHFVAEYVARQDTATAFAILRKHLWYDSDWQIAAPAAIAAHNRNHPGELLDWILDMIDQIEARPSLLWPPASEQIDNVLARVLTESEPSEWIPRHQEILHRCRVANVIRDPEIIARTSHWPGSNHQARVAVLAALPLAHPSTLYDLVHVLPALVASGDERTEARAAVLAAMPRANSYARHDLVNVLVALVEAESERTEARATVLAILPDASPRSLPDLAEVLLSLRASTQERAKARTAIMAALPSAGVFQLHDLVSVLPALAETESERADARTALLAALPTSSVAIIRHLVMVLPALVPTEGERVEARESLLAILPGATSSALPDLVEVVLSLKPSWKERADSRATVLAAIPGASRTLLQGLAEFLPSLVETRAERAEARAVVLAAIPSASRAVLQGLAEFLLFLVETQEERAEARAALLAALTNAGSSAVPDLARLLLALVETGDERAEAREGVLDALHDAYWPAIPNLLEVLQSLVKTPGEQAQARPVLLDVLPNVEPPAIHDLTGLLLSWGATQDEQTRARTALLSAIRGADPADVGGLVQALASLRPTPEEEAEARTALTAAMPKARPEILRGMVDVLLAMRPSSEERDKGRAVLLAALAGAEPYTRLELVDAFPRLIQAREDQIDARTTLLAALPSTAPSVFPHLVEVLLTLVETDAERAEVRAALRTALPGAEPYILRPLVEFLWKFGPSPEERIEARAAMLSALPHASSSALPNLVEGLLPLGISRDDRSDARGTLLAALPGAAMFDIHDLVAALLRLVETGDERAEVRAALLAAMPRSEAGILYDLLGALPSLVKTCDERAQARAVLLEALPEAKPHILRGLVEALPSLAQTRSERAEVRTALLGVIPNAELIVVRDVVDAVLSLIESPDERTKVRRALVEALSEANPAIHRYLVDVLPSLVKTEEDREALRREVSSTTLRDPDTHLTSTLRPILSFEDWISLMAERSITQASDHLAVSRPPQSAPVRFSSRTNRSTTTPSIEGSEHTSRGPDGYVEDVPLHSEEWE
jgi:hypothetical protein